MREHSRFSFRLPRTGLRRNRPVSRSGRPVGAAAVALAVLGGLAFAGGQPMSAAQPALAAEAAQAAPAALAGSHRDGVQQALDSLVRDGDFPGALAAVQGRDGRIRNYTAGVGDLRTRAKVPTDGYVRIASNTKTFTAVVVLQLVGEGKVGLDESVETYLPGLLRGDGIDGHNITVRQLLQHTTGLPSYTDFLADGILPFQHTYFQPLELVKMAVAKKATATPGKEFQYSNTNYVVAGLLIEKVTGRPVIEEITNRTIKRIGLRETYFPNVGDETIRKPHAKGYHRDDPSKPYTDVTETDPSLGWAAGQVIATPSDIGRFFTALLDGKLLEPAQLDQMRETIPAPDFPEGSEYGLGLVSTPLTCGDLSWGHGGSIQGYSTTNAATDDGRATTIALTRLPATQAEVDKVTAVLDTALCG